MRLSEAWDWLDRMEAYDFVFDAETDSDATNAAAPNAHRGWTGQLGPGVGDAHWPRSTVTGLPMLHGITVELTEAYRRRGEELVAISFFQGDGQFRDEDDAAVPDAESDDPFLRQLATYVPLDRETKLEDIIGGEFATLWLTREEFERGPSAPPEDVREPDTHTNEDDEGVNAWDVPEWADEPETRHFHLVVRDDPNAGLAPESDGYVEPFDSGARDWHAWAAPLVEPMHLGGTAFPVQGLPEGLSAYYLEVDELPGMNLGGDGRAQIDLETGAFDWACG